MEEKATVKKEKETSIVNMMAFTTLIVFALLEVLSALKPVIMLSPALMNVLTTVKNLCIVLVIGVLAYRFVEKKSKGTKITFWVSIGIFIISTILTWILNK